MKVFTDEACLVARFYIWIFSLQLQRKCSEMSHDMKELEDMIKDMEHYYDKWFQISVDADDEHV